MVAAYTSIWWWVKVLATHGVKPESTLLWVTWDSIKRQPILPGLCSVPVGAVNSRTGSRHYGIHSATKFNYPHVSSKRRTFELNAALVTSREYALWWRNRFHNRCWHYTHLKKNSQEFIPVLAAGLGLGPWFLHLCLFIHMRFISYAFILRYKLRRVVS